MSCSPGDYSNDTRNNRSSGIQFITALVKTAVSQTSVPVVLHLDHGDTYEEVLECIRYGYTSVMIDGSSLSFNENVNIVQEVERAAHAVGVRVEAELGHVGTVDEDGTDGYTNPELAREFVRQTKIDSLAVAIGTAQGQYRSEPKLDLERPTQLASNVDVPLVLHGASGVPDEAMRVIIEKAISKFNIATEIKVPFAAALRDYLAKFPEDYDPSQFMRQRKNAYEEALIQKILLAGSSGRAQ